MTIYVIVFLVAFGASQVLTLPVKRLAERLGAIDYPEKRKIHAAPTPRMGGLAVFLAFSLAVTAGFMSNPVFRKNLIPSFWGFCLGAVIVIVIGMLDDAKSLRPVLKFLGQLAAGAVFLWFSNNVSTGFTNPFGETRFVVPHVLGYSLSLLWIVGIINAMNFIDGLDGLANGIGFLVSTTLLVVNLNLSQHFEAFLYIALVGSTLGFAKFNEYPAKIFLGDTGSHFLGYTLACLGLMSTTKATTLSILLIPLVTLGLPIFDVLTAVIRRSREGKNIFMPDRKHIHHKLLEWGFTQQEAVRVLYIACVILCIFSFILMNIRDEYATLVVVFAASATWVCSSRFNLLGNSTQKPVPGAEPQDEAKSPGEPGD